MRFTRLLGVILLLFYIQVSSCYADITPKTGYNYLAFTKSEAQFRTGPSKTSDSYGVMPKDVPLIITGFDGSKEYQKARTLDGDYEGYIHKSLLVFEYQAITPLQGKSYLVLTLDSGKLSSNKNGGGLTAYSYKAGEQLCVDDYNRFSDFQSATHIESGTEGYITTNANVIYIDEITESDGKFFVKESEGTTNTEITVTNDTDKYMTLKVGDKTYSFSPHQKKEIVLTPATLKFKASAAGVIPLIGSKNFEPGYYTWDFFIKTSYR